MVRVTSAYCSTRATGKCPIQRSLAARAYHTVIGNEDPYKWTRAQRNAAIDWVRVFEERLMDFEFIRRVNPYELHVRVEGVSQTTGGTPIVHVEILEANDAAPVASRAVGYVGWRSQTPRL